MNRSLIKIILALIVAGVFVALWYFDVGRYLTLDAIRAQQESLKSYRADHPFIVFCVFFLGYVMASALSLPGAAIMTLLGGALLGFWQGLIAVSFASSIGAIFAFLMARFLLKDWVQNKYSKQLSILNEGFKKEGSFYLFALRLIPIFPFFLVNILTGLMPIKTRNFYIASQLGMLPGTTIYVYAGTELGKLQSLSDIASPSLLVAFVALGLFPLMAKKIITLLRNRKKQ